jgi:mono/diheme cytochrome c family protein
MEYESLPRMNPRIYLLLATIAGVFALVGCGAGESAATVAYPIIPDASGESQYAANCQVCHGNPATGDERQLDAPRHDGDGHTWHHADRPLVEWVLNGVPGGSGLMPAFSDQLSKAEVASIIAYIKSTWTPELQASQMENSQAWENQLVK